VCAYLVGFYCILLLTGIGVYRFLFYRKAM
jgi:hypothetical protein